MDWRGVGSNPAGDIYFHFEFFAPSPFRTGQRSRCKWNQACPFTWSHSCFRPQIWFIIQGLVYKYLQYSFKCWLYLASSSCYRLKFNKLGRPTWMYDLWNVKSNINTPQFHKTGIWMKGSSNSTFLNKQGKLLKGIGNTFKLYTSTFRSPNSHPSYFAKNRDKYADMNNTCVSLECMRPELVNHINLTLSSTQITKLHLFLTVLCNRYFCDVYGPCTMNLVIFRFFCLQFW